MSHLPEPGRSSPGHITSELGLASQAPWMTDRLISIQDIRELFRLGRTAAYELTHRPDFPEPVVISPRCYRWWAAEVTAFAVGIRRESAELRRPSNTGHVTRQHGAHLSTPPRRISGNVRLAHTRRKRRDCG